MAGAVATAIEIVKHSPFFFWGFIPFVSGTGVPAHALLPEAPERVAEVRVLVVGDMLFDRSFRSLAEQGSDKLLNCMDPLLIQADFAVGNLEGPITSAPSVSRGSVVGSAQNTTFTFPPVVPTLLLRHGFALVNLGNNHIGNMGGEGITATHQHLTHAGVGYFGGLSGSEPVARTEHMGIPLSFVSYNEFGGMAPEKVAQVVAKERAAGRVVVVYTHWGDEYSTAVTRLRPIALLFAQTGASAVIGSHSHVVGPHETLYGVPVYYSLGNFIFDQYWDESVSRGLALLVALRADGTVSIKERTVVMSPDGRTCPL